MTLVGGTVILFIEMGGAGLRDVPGISDLVILEIPIMLLSRGWIWLHESGAQWRLSVWVRI